MAGEIHRIHRERRSLWREGFIVFAGARKPVAAGIHSIRRSEEAYGGGIHSIHKERNSLWREGFIGFAGSEEACGGRDSYDS